LARKLQLNPAFKTIKPGDAAGDDWVNEPSIPVYQAEGSHGLGQSRPACEVDVEPRALTSIRR
jgi:hypothetical protein